MDDRVEVRIYPQSREGDHETALMRFPDGFGGGGGSAGFTGWLPDPINVENNDTPLEIPFASFSDGLHIRGDFDADDAPAGLYLAKLYANFGNTTPTNGLAQFVLSHTSNDAEPVETLICALELNVLHNAEGFGDVQLGPNGVGEKLGMSLVPSDGRLTAYILQNTDLHPLSFSGSLMVARL